MRKRTTSSTSLHDLGPLWTAAERHNVISCVMIYGRAAVKSLLRQQHGSANQVGSHTCSTPRKACRAAQIPPLCMAVLRKPSKQSATCSMPPVAEEGGGGRWPRRGTGKRARRAYYTCTLTFEAQKGEVHLVLALPVQHGGRLKESGRLRGAASAPPETTAKVRAPCSNFSALPIPQTCP
jgi:hypothetical protein